MDADIQDELELDLLALDGQALLDEVHDEAGAYVDREYPWDGQGDEPPERVSAYLAVLWRGWNRPVSDGASRCWH